MFVFCDCLFAKFVDVQEVARLRSKGCDGSAGNAGKSLGYRNALKYLNSGDVWDFAQLS